MLAVFCEFERDILRDRAKAGIAQATGLDAYVTFAPGTVLEILLNPVGPLLDGTAAGQLIFKRSTSWQTPDQRADGTRRYA